MAGASSKRVEAETRSNTSTTSRRAKDGRAFTRCEGCNKNIAVALISMHDCSLDTKIRVNLEAQVVKTQAEANMKLPEKKKSTSNEPKPKRVRTKEEKKSSSTSNKPKRPLTAFSIFMNGFRQTYQDDNPYINVKDVAKKGAEKWKSLTEEAKKDYLCKAAELKADYNKLLEENDANEEEEDEEMQSHDLDVADEAEEKEVENTDSDNKGAEGKRRRRRRRDVG